MGWISELPWDKRQYDFVFIFVGHQQNICSSYFIRNQTCENLHANFRLKYVRIKYANIQLIKASMEAYGNRDHTNISDAIHSILPSPRAHKIPTRYSVWWNPNVYEPKRFVDWKMKMLFLDFPGYLKIHHKVTSSGWNVSAEIAAWGNIIIFGMYLCFNGAWYLYIKISTQQGKDIESGRYWWLWGRDFDMLKHVSESRTLRLHFNVYIIIFLYERAGFKMNYMNDYNDEHFQ